MPFFFEPLCQLHVLIFMALTTEREKIAHLLRRFGFGASEAELNFYAGKGLAGTIDLLLNPEQVPEAFDFDVERLRSPRDKSLNIAAVQSWWYYRMLATTRPLVEQMTLFWHDHFATSAAKVDVSIAMHAQIETIRANCLGKFKDLLIAVSQDPAMIYWLDNQFNVKGKPNENFSREIMELFTVGIGHYTEKDVQEAARAFTGWTYGVGRRAFQPDKPRGGAQFVFREERHDFGTKVILGNTGDFDGLDVIGILCGNPNTSRTISNKVWEWFAYTNPDDAIIDRLAAKFTASGLNIKALLREIMNSPEFYSSKAERKIVKNPVSFCISTLRQLGFGASITRQIGEPTGDAEVDAGNVRRAIYPTRVILNGTNSMGMKVMFPPDVAGWDSGIGWISSATMIERIKWADRIFGTQVARGDISLRYPAESFVDGSGSPESLVRALISVFDAPIPETKVPNLIKAARDATGGGLVNRTNASAAAIAVTRLIFGSPEFQFN